jgi:DNA polymerase III subunit epsilon
MAASSKGPELQAAASEPKIGWLSPWLNSVLHRLGALSPLSVEVSSSERWVVLDVETTGLDPSVDELLAIAAVAVEVDWRAKSCCLLPMDTFERFVRPPAIFSDESNVLVHGIGRGVQAQAEPPGPVLKDFAAWVSGAPLLAFHAAFDKAMMGKAYAQAGLSNLDGPWLDLAEVCRVMWPQHSQLHALDDWLSHFALECTHRHQAASDAWVEAEVLQVAWPKIATQCDNFKQLLKLSKQARWLDN